eukprot:COSAG03_NODE_519_length_7216_cov_23.238724_4_plen_667_part_00
MIPHVRTGRVAPLPSKQRPSTAPAGGRSRRSTRVPAAARWSGIETVELLNDDWDRVAGRMDPGRTLGAALAEHSLEATRDIKRWENALLHEQVAELEACGVNRWLETTKRGLGLFLCVDSGGRLVVSGVETPSSASKEGVPVGCEVLSINGAPVYPDETGTTAVTALLSTVCHRRVKLVLSPPAPSTLGTAGLRAWQPFPEFEALKSVGEPLITIEHCCGCADHQVTTRHDESKYVAVANELKEAIQDLVPYATVELKPYERHEPMSRGRLGTMEVQLGWRGTDGGLCKRVVFSKRVRGCWPKVWKVAETILAQLKLTPAIAAYANPQLAGATDIPASVQESAAPANRANQPPLTAEGQLAGDTDGEEDENEDTDGPKPVPPVPPRTKAASESAPGIDTATQDRSSATTGRQPEPEPEPETSSEAGAPLASISGAEPGDAAAINTRVELEAEAHPERARWTAAVGRWVRVDPNCDDEDTVAEMEGFSPGGGGLCRLCEVLPELEEGLLMLLLERTAVPPTEGEQDEEAVGDLRTDVYPCDVIELVADADAARALDAKFGTAGEWAARCAEAHIDRAALASALDAAKAQAAVCHVRIRRQGQGSGGLYCTAAHELAAARGNPAHDPVATLIAVSDEVGGYDDRPFTVEVSGATFYFAEGEIEMLQPQ